MGTNFYYHEYRDEPCSHCGRYDLKELHHLGKSSAGWCFGLHVEPEQGIHDLHDWVRLVESTPGHIENEYGERCDLRKFLHWVTEREGPEAIDDLTVMQRENYGTVERFLEMNKAERGPNNLLRRRLGQGCVKHGAGTWDCIVGEFS